MLKNSVCIRTEVQDCLELRIGLEVYFLQQRRYPTDGGTALSWRWGLWASKILQISLFRFPKRRRPLRVPQFCPQNSAYGGAKISGDPVESVCSQGVLAVSLTCEHSQELTSGLLKLKATGVFMASVPFTAI